MCDVQPGATVVQSASVLLYPRPIQKMSPCFFVVMYPGQRTIPPHGDRRAGPRWTARSGGVMSTVESPAVDNGVNVEALLGAREALAASPEAAQFQWRARCEWINGTHSRTTVHDFSGLGAEHTHRAPFTFEGDHPEVFASEDHGATPTEIALGGAGRLPDRGHRRGRHPPRCAAALGQRRAGGRSRPPRDPRRRSRRAQRVQRRAGALRDRRRRLARRTSRPSSRSRRSGRRSTTSSPTRPPCTVEVD